MFADRAETKVRAQKLSAAGFSLFVAAVFFFIQIPNISASAANDPPKVAVPEENRDGATKPDFSSAEIMSHSIIEAVLSGNTERAVPAFFPESQFIALKDISQADKYYAQLRSAFAADLLKHKLKVTSENFAFAAFKPGFCKWKPISSEYNRIPYWSCYHNKISLSTSSGSKASIEVRVIINWGKQWYVTHLGPPL